MWKLSEKAQALVQQLHDLLSLTSWFGRAKREENIMNLLDRIKVQGEPAAVRAVAGCLFSSSQHVRIAASRTIHRLLSLVSPDQLIQLSGVIGWSCGWYVSEHWDKLRDRDVSALLVDPETKTAILGLLSFHRNGYVRQEAVRRLARARNGDELRFLLIRQNDWVKPISVEAQQAVNDRLTSSYLPLFVRSLPIVVHLLAFRRRDLSLVVQKVVEMLVQPEHDALLAQAIGGSNLSIRRQVVQMALDIAGEHQGRIVRHGLASADAIVRLACAKRVRQILVGPDLRQTIAHLQNDRYMPVRREGFRMEADTYPDAATKTWHRALLDSNASIRELARYSLGKIGAFNAAAFYRQNLTELGVSLAAISGIAECGGPSDLRALQGLLVHPLPKFRRAAIRGIARIAKEGAADLVRSLRDRSPSVVREAKKQLESFVNDVPGQALFAIVTDSNSELARRCALQLIFQKGKWQSLPWLIRAASHADKATASLARRFIEAWFAPAMLNRVFTKPSATERQAMDEAMQGLRTEDGYAYLAQLQKWFREI